MGPGILGEMLRLARTHRKRVSGLKLSDAGLAQEDWLCLVGVDSRTRVRLQIRKDRGKALFKLTGKDREHRWKPPIRGLSLKA